MSVKTSNRVAPCLHETGPWPAGQQWPKCLKCEIERLTRELEIQQKVNELAYVPHRNLVASRDAVVAERDRLRAEFKNFHRLLCERFDYGHDEVDWERDQLSLIEHVAAHTERLGGAQSASLTEPEGEPKTVKNWPPRFRVDPVGGVVLALMLVRDGKRTVEEVAPYLILKPDEPGGST